MTSRTQPLKTDDEGIRVLNAVRRLVRALRLFDREAQSKYGLSAAQIFVLHALSDGEVLSLNEVAERTATDQSSASVVVQRLVDAGLVSRTPRAEDRRHVDLKLTPKGRNVTRRSPAPAQTRILDAVAAMSARDRRTFAGLLEGFVEGVGGSRGATPMLFEDDPPAPKKRAKKAV